MPTPNLPGVNTTLLDTYSALRASYEAYSDRVVILARTGTGSQPTGPDPAYAHENEPKRYTSLANVASVHGTESELYEAFYHAQYSGCVDIWLCPITGTPATDRTTALNSAYETLYSIRPSIIVPYGRGARVDINANGVATRSVPQFGDSPQFTDGAYANSSFSYIDDLADACADLSSSERICIGIIGMEAFADVTPSSLVTLIGEYGSEGTLFDDIITPAELTTPANGKFVNLVLGEVETAGMGPWAWRNGVTTSYYRSNGALNYAGLISKLAVDDAPTNKIVSGISNIGYKLSRNQTLSCVGKQIVTFNVNNGIVRVDDAMTYAPVGSDFQRLSTVRIIAVCDDMIRRVGQKFIGKGMRIDTRNSFTTAIASGFDNLMSSGIILEADFRVRYDGANYTAYVDAVVVPAWELRRIEFTIQVTFQGITASRVLQ